VNRRALIAAAAIGGLAIVLAAVALWPRPDLVVYTSADSAYSLPLAQAFEKRTGIRVALVPDAESAKTTGLYQRLLAEKGRPRADVFWNSEITRTVLLARKGVLEACEPPAARDLPPQFCPKSALWHGFACRVRVIIYNQNLVKTKEQAPQSVLDLAEPKWKGQVALAYPLFGTTAAHAAALRVHLGRAAADGFFRKLVANGAQVVNGNGIVADRVASGQAAVGLTDTDDAWTRIDDGKPLGILYPDQGPGQMGALVIPNTAGRVAGAPHREAAGLFLDFLCSAEAEAMLAQPPARHLPTRPDKVKTAADTAALREIRSLKVDWERVADEIEVQAAELEKIFGR